MSPRYSTVRSTTIEYGYWLVFDADGGVRFSRGEPATGRGEVAMACVATLPRELFRKPTLSATIKVDPGEPKAFHIDVQAAGQALKGVLGVDVDMRIETVDPDA